MRRRDEERFPVLYVTDANAAFETAAGISHALQLAGDVRRFIVAGIGYPGDSPFAGVVLRGRDFTSSRRVEIPVTSRTLPIEGMAGIDPGKKSWGGAADFLAFVRHELFALIDRCYPTLPDERAYFGHSMGGGLGVHALFCESGLFGRYILSSPTLSWEGDEHGVTLAREFIESRRRLEARVFMSVGAEEEFDPLMRKLQFVSSFFRMAALLRAAQIPGLDLHCHVFPGETHASVWPAAFSRGVRVVYGPAKCPPLGTPEWAAP